MENEPVQQLRVEVGGLLRQELASTHDRLQLRGRRRGDQERRLTLALAGEPDRLGPVRRVVHVRLRVELGVGDAEQRAEQSLVEDRHGEPPPGAWSPARPRYATQP